MQELQRCLAGDPGRIVRLYHGTSSRHPILREGLLPTCRTRAKSLSSSCGYVYLSVFPGMARAFAELAYPFGQIIVYQVDICARRLLPDLDQLKSVRYFKGADCGQTLAESLVYGRGARVKGKIDPSLISIYTPREI